MYVLEMPDRVAVEEVVHFLWIACENDYHIVTVVLHFLHDSVYGFVAIRARAVIAKGIGFVDKKH